MQIHTQCAYRTGRHIIGQLPHGADLITAIQTLVESTSVCMAVFSIVGSVSSATYGVFDQTQQVYITDQVDDAFDIASATGSAYRQRNETDVNLHAVLVDNNGQTSGGRLFSPTRVFAVEVSLTELKGPELQRQYDPLTGLMLWSFQKANGTCDPSK